MRNGGRRKPPPNFFRKSTWYNLNTVTKIFSVFFSVLLLAAPARSFASTSYIPGPQITTPTVVTENASVSGAQATVSVRVNPNRGATQIWVEYGATSALGQTSGLVDISNGSEQTVKITLSELSPNTKYYYRGVARNLAGTGKGTTLSFVTKSESVSGRRLPLVQSVSVADINARYALLAASVNPQGYATQAWFEYGFDEALGEKTVKQSLGSGTAWKSFETDLALQKNTEYFYRAVAENANGIARTKIEKIISAGDPEFAIEPETVILQPGKSIQLRAFYDVDGSGDSPRTEVTDRASWLSSNTQLAIHRGGGMFVARSPGAVTVTALFNPEGVVGNVDDLDNMRAEAGFSIPSTAGPSAPSGQQGGGEVVNLTGTAAPSSTPPAASADPIRITLAVLVFILPIAIVGGGGYFILKKIRG